MFRNAYQRACECACNQHVYKYLTAACMADGTGPLPSLTRNALWTLDGSVACVLSSGVTKKTSLLSSKGELVREQFVLLSFCEIMLDRCSLTPCCRTLSTPEVANSGTVLIPACHLDKKGNGGSLDQARQHNQSVHCQSRAAAHQQKDARSVRGLPAPSNVSD